jgi:hypothetical protein
MPTSGRSQVYSTQAPEILGRAIRRAPHREAFVPDVKLLGVQSRLAGLRKHTDLRRSRIWGAQLGWQGLNIPRYCKTKVFKARRPQGGRFGVQTTNIAAGHLAEPLYQGIGDLSNDRHTNHGGLTKIVDLLSTSALHGSADFQGPRMIW